MRPGEGLGLGLEVECTLWMFSEVTLAVFVTEGHRGVAATTPCTSPAHSHSVSVPSPRVIGCHSESLAKSQKDSGFHLAGPLSLPQPLASNQLPGRELPYGEAEWRGVGEACSQQPARN